MKLELLSHIERLEARRRATRGTKERLVDYSLFGRFVSALFEAGLENVVNTLSNFKIWRDNAMFIK